MPVAEADLAALQDFVSQSDSRAAQEIVTDLRIRASSLCAYPQRGRFVPELLEHGNRSYRELICAPWRIIYRMHGNKVVVFGVLDGRRRLEDFLLERLVR
jgi:plasmid stabilization system protein ParE